MKSCVERLKAKRYVCDAGDKTVMLVGICGGLISDSATSMHGMSSASAYEAWERDAQVTCPTSGCTKRCQASHTCTQCSPVSKL